MESVKRHPDFASRFRELCGVAEQNELVDILDVTKNTFRQWTNGNSTPTMERLIKLAEYFHVTTDFLLGLTDVKSPDIGIQAAVMRYGLSEQSFEALESLAQGRKELELIPRLPGIFYKPADQLLQALNDLILGGEDVLGAIWAFLYLPITSAVTITFSNNTEKREMRLAKGRGSGIYFSIINEGLSSLRNRLQDGGMNKPRIKTKPTKP
jgi:transcriptional regulator with XRE-family HTH domain